MAQFPVDGVYGVHPVRFDLFGIPFYHMRHPIAPRMSGPPHNRLASSSNYQYNTVHSAWFNQAFRRKALFAEKLLRGGFAPHLH